MPVIHIEIIHLQINSDTRVRHHRAGIDADSLTHDSLRIQSALQTNIFSNLSRPLGASI